jgi:lipopolysaccharide export system protein LptA
MSGLLRHNLLLVMGIIALLLLGVVHWLHAADAADTSFITFDFSHVTGKKLPDGSRITQYDQATATQGDAQFSADLIEDNSHSNVHDFTCTGNPKFSDPENIITATRVIGHSTPRSADFLGNVVADSKPRVDTSGKGLRGNPTHITSDKLTYDYARKWGEFSSNVIMVITPRHLAKVANTNDVNSQLNSAPTTITCDALSYDANTKKALAKNNVVVKQKGRTLWADQGTYDEDADLVMLSGHVRIKNEGEGEVKSVENADKVSVSVSGADDWIDMVALPGTRIRMVLEVQNKEETAPEGATKPK